MRGGQRRAERAGVRRLRDPAQPPRAADGAARRRRRAAEPLHGTRWSRSTSWTRSAPTGVVDGAGRARRRSPKRRAQRVLEAFACRPRRPTTPSLQRLVAAGRRDAAGVARACRPARDPRSCRRRHRAGAHLRLDPSLARGLSYYTGAIMEIDVPTGRQPRRRRALRQPGRHVLRASVPACGFSLGLERILVVMAERGMFPADGRRAPRRRDGDGLERRVASADTPARWRALLRADGPARRWSTRTPTRSASRSSTLSTAASASSPSSATTRRAAGTVTVKDLTTGEQTPVPRAEVAAGSAARRRIRVIRRRNRRSAIVNHG